MEIEEGSVGKEKIGMESYDMMCGEIGGERISIHVEKLVKSYHKMILLSYGLVVLGIINSIILNGTLKGYFFLFLTVGLFIMSIGNSIMYLKNRRRRISYIHVDQSGIRTDRDYFLMRDIKTVKLKEPRFFKDFLRSRYLIITTADEKSKYWLGNISSELSLGICVGIGKTICQYMSKSDIELNIDIM